MIDKGNRSRISQITTRFLQRTLFRPRRRRSDHRATTACRHLVRRAAVRRHQTRAAALASRNATIRSASIRVTCSEQIRFNDQQSINKPLIDFVPVRSRTSERSGCCACSFERVDATTFVVFSDYELSNNRTPFRSSRLLLFCALICAFARATTTTTNSAAVSNREPDAAAAETGARPASRARRSTTSPRCPSRRTTASIFVFVAVCCR